MRMLRWFLPLTIMIVYAVAVLPLYAASYTLGPEDAVSISVMRHPEFSGEYLVPPDGKLNLPAVGAVQVNGKTLDELTQYVTDQLKERLVKPQVTVTLRSLRMQRVYILGAVGKPGIYDLKQDWRVTEALAAAGGLVRENAECKAMLLRGTTGEQIAVSLASALAGDVKANLRINAGDVLSIEAVELLPVYVMGEVKNPGMYEMRSGMGIVQALAQAGGLSVPVHDVKAIILRGGREVSNVDLKAAVVDGEAKANLLLQRGDVLRISSLRSMGVMVAGKVQHPGTYQLKDGDGIVEALTAAGGPLETAALTRVSVVRAGGATEVVDIAPAMLKGDTSVNRKLGGGDLVLVPEAIAQFTVLGFVNQPGSYSLPDGKQVTLTEAIGLAKGITIKRGSLGKVAILHTEGKDQQRKIFDIRKFLKSGDVTQNPQIAAGDIIYIPETDNPDWQQVFQVISTFGIIRGLL